MKKNQIEDYINKLKNLELKLNLSETPDNKMSNNFINELNSVLTTISKDVEDEMAKKVQIIPPLNVRFKKLNPNAVTPTYAKEGDAGLDLTALIQTDNTTFQAVYGTGISIEIPEGYVGLVFPRSSIRNYDLELSNSVGVIDSGYRGEIILTFNKLDGLNSLKYKAGDRIGQIIIVPYPQINLIESEKLTETKRGDKGFGASGI